MALIRWRVGIARFLVETHASESTLGMYDMIINIVNSLSISRYSVTSICGIGDAVRQDVGM